MNQADMDRAIADSVQIVSTSRAELMGLLELVRADFDGIPRSGFDTPTALEFQGLVNSWTELAAELIGAITSFEDALRESAPLDARGVPRRAPVDPGNIGLEESLERLDDALQSRLPHWPEALAQQFQRAKADALKACEGLAFVKQQVEYLVLGVGSDA